MSTHGFSENVQNLRKSITHGTKAKIAELNESLGDYGQIVDLSIGTLDEKTDPRIDDFVIEFIRKNPEKIHEFAPVTGFQFLRESISDRVKRLRDIYYSPNDEIMVTPGGIKGAISVVFHTLLNPGDEVVVPFPNWPHYADMIELHGANIKGVFSGDFREKGLTPESLEGAINSKTKIVILGDCVNPSGKIYKISELEKLAEVIAKHNTQRANEGAPPIHVLYDCPYEAHILKDRPPTISDSNVTLADGRVYSMRGCTTIVTGPGKTYGMHGDRIGYICTSSTYLRMMEKVQVNLNSFASTYGQVATHAAMHPDMDSVAHARAKRSRKNLSEFLERLNGISGVEAPTPEGGYFAFVDLSALKNHIVGKGYERADEFLLDMAKVASISGIHFAENVPEMKFYVRMNCGRDQSVLEEAVNRIEAAVESLTEDPFGQLAK